MVSCYVTSSKKVVIVAMNDTEKPVQSIAYDPAKVESLGVNILSLRNLETNQEIKATDGVIEVTVPPRDYVLLGDFGPVEGIVTPK